MPPPTPIAASPQSNRLETSVTRTMVERGAVAAASPADAVKSESRLGWADDGRSGERDSHRDREAGGETLSMSKHLRSSLMVELRRGSLQCAGMVVAAGSARLRTAAVP